MFGTVGVQEMVVIFIVALVLFGPKKLPELGRTIGKALTEFRRASTDLKASFEREMHNLERETEALKEPVSTTPSIPSSYADYEYPYTDSYSTEPESSTSSTVSASTTSGADSHGASDAHRPAEPANLALPEDHVPNGVEGTVARSEATPQHS